MKKGISSPKFGSCDIYQIANSVLTRGKSSVPLLIDGLEVLSFSFDEAILFSENFHENL